MAGTKKTEVRLNGWCEGGLGKQRNDGVNARRVEIGKSGEPWYISN